MYVIKASKTSPDNFSDEHGQQLHKLDMAQCELVLQAELW